ncbi:unnamed protein product [Rotaria sp. Silwood2]|nr:unnamed protein product [Rotaria sp. Silwood2]CAF4482900.1 unnamed protein product [Rotaria sp. Silwood2]
MNHIQREFAIEKIQHICVGEAINEIDHQQRPSSSSSVLTTTTTTTTAAATTKVATSKVATETAASSVRISFDKNQSFILKIKTNVRKQTEERRKHNNRKAEQRVKRAQTSIVLKDEPMDKIYMYQ